MGDRCHGMGVDPVEDSIMKYILHIAAHLYIGGAEKVARDIGLYADPSEYEMHYIVFDDDIGVYGRELEAKGCKVFRFAEPSHNYARYLKELKQLMTQYPYAAIHAHTMFNCGWAMWMGKRMGIPIRVAHAHSALDDGSGLAKTVYEALMRFFVLRCATDLVGCGKKAGQRLFGQKAFAERGQLIVNGIDVPAFAYCEETRARMRAQLHVEKCFVIGHAGHMAEVKNQKFLLELMPLVLQKRPDAMLILLGDGEDRPMLEEKARQLGLTEHVRMTGNVTNVADYLNAMDVFAFPSLYEGTPLAILEAQANGLPCVLSDGVPEDVFLTDLIHVLSLSESVQTWVDTICAMKRREPADYAELLKDSDFASEVSIRKIYDIYEREMKR